MYVTLGRAFKRNAICRWSLDRRNVGVPSTTELFTRVKQLLTEAPALHFPDFSREFVIHVDATSSEAGAGAFLAQLNGDDLSIIAYFSQCFSRSQRHYSAVVHTHTHTRVLPSGTGNTALQTIFTRKTLGVCD